MAAGKIARLVPLTSQSEIERTQLVPGHNEMGFGYIDAPDGESIYFPHEAAEGCAFEELWVGQEVEYALDPSDSHRARQVKLVHHDAHLQRMGERMPPPEGYSQTGDPSVSRAAGSPAASRPAEELPHRTNEELLAALADLEQQLETPVVPGELTSWLAELEDPLRQVAQIHPAVVSREHAATLRMIAREDPELQRRVEQMQEEDQRLAVEYAEFIEMYGRLRPAIEHAEPDESKAEGLMEEFVSRGLGFVIAARKQELALRTWLLESLERDRGPVD